MQSIDIEHQQIMSRLSLYDQSLCTITHPTRIRSDDRFDYNGREKRDAIDWAEKG